MATQAITRGLLSLSLVLVATATQAQPQVTVIARGLNNPRGLDFAPNGTLYVAEAGVGAGDAKGGFAVGVGFTGSITEITAVNSPNPASRRIVTGLASVGDTENGFPEALGPSGVSVHGRGGIYVTIGESALGVAANHPNLPVAARRQFGHVLKVTPSGHWKAVSDVGDFDYLWTGENQDQPWAPPGQYPDANPYGVLATAGRQFVTDAGANTVTATCRVWTASVSAATTPPIPWRPSSRPSQVPPSPRTTVATPTGLPPVSPPAIPTMPIATRPAPVSGPRTSRRISATST